MRLKLPLLRLLIVLGLLHLYLRYARNAELLAMLAPRPVMLIAGETDAWSDPYGEFLAARLATPVYRLFGKEGVDGIPQIDVQTRGDLVYMMHSAGHGPAPQDTPAILAFLDRNLRAS